MSFQIPLSHKFSCFALEGVGLASGFRDPIDLGAGFWAVFDAPFALNASWREWLGTLQADRLQRSNVTLLATAISKQPEILDAENDTLRSLRNWHPSDLPTWLNEDCYRREILPRLSKFTVKRIRLAIDVSHPYATLIRLGVSIPHPRHWLPLAELTGLSTQSA